MAAAPEIESLKEAFEGYTGSSSDPKTKHTISLEKVNKWMEKAKIIGTIITKEDTEAVFMKQGKEHMDYETFMVFLDELSTTKSYDLTEMKHHLAEAKPSAMAKVGKKLSNTATNIKEFVTDAVGHHKDKSNERN